MQIKVKVNVEVYSLVSHTKDNSRDVHTIIPWSQDASTHKPSQLPREHTARLPVPGHINYSNTKGFSVLLDVTCTVFLHCGWLTYPHYIVLYCIVLYCIVLYCICLPVLALSFCLCLSVCLSVSPSFHWKICELKMTSVFHLFRCRFVCLTWYRSQTQMVPFPQSTPMSF